MHPHIIAPAFYGTATYDGVKGFTHIAYLGGVPVGMLVHSSLNVRTYREFLTWAKAQNKPIDYVSSGTATYGYLFGSELARKEGLVFNHIPYKGAGPAMLDLVAGHVRVATISFSTGAEHVRSGTLHALGISSNERLHSFPDVPTFKELGHEDMTSGSWFAISGPPNLRPRSCPSSITSYGKFCRIRKSGSAWIETALKPATCRWSNCRSFSFRKSGRWGPVAKALSGLAK